MAFWCNGKKGICEQNDSVFCGKCEYLDGSGGYDIPYAPKLLQTNADRIRAMSDEELGIFLAEWAERPLAWKMDGEGECLAWLQEPVKDGESGG